MWVPSMAHTQSLIPFRDANFSLEVAISRALGSLISFPYLAEGTCTQLLQSARKRIEGGA